MMTGQIHRRAVWSIVVAAFVTFVLLLPPGDVRAITFGEWATNKGWTDGHAMPRYVYANVASIHNLAGMDHYNWMATPTVSLYLDDNQIASIKSGDFTALGGVANLYLYHNQIASIESGDFAGLGALTTLDLTNNQITSIESGDFAGPSSLTTLSMDYNQITSIEPGDFTGLGSLTTLRLSNNQITSLESGDFTGLNGLQSLELNHNQIASIESGFFTFTGLRRLSALDLSFNQIGRLESNVFSGLDTLTTLNLASSQITAIESGAFNGLPFVSNLDLSGNQITTLESGGFTGLCQFIPKWTLNLSNNQITTIKSGAFTGLRSVTDLDLSGNQITTLESGVFTGLQGLQYLDLEGSHITSIKSGAFTGLGNLTALSLNSNQITSIESGDFTGLDKLTALRLNSNQITSIESGAFAGLGMLKSLTLGYNTTLTNLNLEEADFSSLNTFDVTNTSIVRVSLKNVVLNQTALVALVNSNRDWSRTGIGDLPGVTELDLSGVDFAAITDLSPLYLMDHVTDLWLVDVLNLDANKLDVMLDNLGTMQNPSVEGALYLTQADFDAFNAAGGNKLALWDAEAGHHVEIVGVGDANGDGLVNDADATILASHWHQADGANWFDGDFNGDGAVNDADASILAVHWNEGAEAATPNVPEPGVLAMLLGAAVVLGLRRRNTWASWPR